MKKFQITEITMQSLKVNQIWKIKVKSDTVDYHGTNHLCLEADPYNVNLSPNVLQSLMKKGNVCTILIYFATVW